ncbi:MAG: ABC-2 type transport system ATP-binding protein [Verrucomicrobia bacterium]|nr:MAG: ABC-2 type transport system ATP-binding protein [Verrucomicrobiota bacterium]
MSISAISIQNLSKEFHVPFRREPLRAVKNLSLEVPAGEVYGLLGPNGSGKSTTMKILLGLVSPSAGSSFLFNVNSRHVESRESVGFLPENPYFYKYLTGLETLLFFGKLCGLRGKTLQDKARLMLQTVGLADAADRRLGGYSKGMLQRIGLAQALIGEPRLLVLDEPTAGVDPAGSHEIRDLILQFKAQGITVLLCSHMLNQVQEICDRIGVMNRGELVAEGRLDELLSSPNQTELVLENASPSLLETCARLAAESGARVVENRKPHADLERFFLKITRQKP